MSPLQISRYTLGVSWVYQGAAPKLFTIAPLEKALTGSMGFSAEISDLITRSAGIGEISFGLLLIACYRNTSLQLLNMAVLIGLLLFSMVMLPSVLFEAFNPVTTNLCMVALSYHLFHAHLGERVQPSN